ncbi:MAG: zinc ribbon domain-containing protein [Proteobacteria bacterium]|nr:zinc ribbon domain-containing protein [Pseudomonadota bacterium]
MPIYEFFCDTCNVIFNFFSPRVNTTKKPDCPRCGKRELDRRISSFATIGKAKEDSGEPLAGLDETKMERAFESLMREAEHVNEEDPKQMAALMRKFTSQTGINLGGPMEEAMSRMEAGEDPEQVEKEMGDLFNEENLSFEQIKKKGMRDNRPPAHDEKLYEL